MNSRTNHTAAGPRLALVAVQIIFGTWPIVGKIALRTLPSTGLVAFRVAGAAAAFLLLLRLKGKLTTPRRGDIARLAVYSLLGVVLNQFLFLKGLELSTVVNATIIGTAIPVFTLLVGALLGFENLSARAAVGTVTAAAGVVYLVDPLRADFSGGKALGNLLLVGNSSVYGAYIAVSKDVFRRYGALTAMTWVFAFGCIATVPVGGFYLSQVPVQNLGWVTWLSVSYIIPHSSFPYAVFKAFSPFSPSPSAMRRSSKSFINASTGESELMSASISSCTMRAPRPQVEASKCSSASPVASSSVAAPPSYSWSSSSARVTTGRGRPASFAA